MPEQLTKHPDVTLQVLRSSGAKCGEGGAPEILKHCPADRFCKLPGGEVCIYGLPQASQMTQISPADWQAVAQTLPVEEGGGQALLAGGAGVVIGVALGVVLMRFRRR